MPDLLTAAPVRNEGAGPGHLGVRDRTLPVVIFCTIQLKKKFIVFSSKENRNATD